MHGRATYQPVDFLGDPPPRDFLVLMAVLFVTFSMGFFGWTQPLVGLLYLSPAVWQRGFLWQLLTYVFAALPDQPFWFLITLLILFMFGKQVRSHLRRRQFWQLLLQAGLTASLVAVAVQILLSFIGWRSLPFLLMQGDRMVLAILIAAYATLFRHAVIRLFFVLPVRARDFLWLEVLFAFMAFLTTRDFAGFVGITTAVGTTYALLTGGLRKALREWRLRLQRLFLEARLRILRRKRKIRLVKPDDGGDARRQGPWIH